MVNPFLETGLFGVEEMEGVEEGVDDGGTDTFAGPDMSLESLTQNLPLKLS